MAIAVSKGKSILNKVTYKLMMEYKDEPVEICKQSSCNYVNYLTFRNSFIKSLYKTMALQFDSVFRLNIKQNNVKINIDWYSEKFNDDLFEWDFGKIKESVREIFATTGVIDRRDKLFNVPDDIYQLININKYYGEENFIVTLEFTKECFNVDNKNNEKVGLN